MDKSRYDSRVMLPLPSFEEHSDHVRLAQVKLKYTACEAY